MNTFLSRRHMLTSTLCAATVWALSNQQPETKAGDVGANEAPNSFRQIKPWQIYVFEDGLEGPDVPTIAAKVALLKSLGYAGMACQSGPAHLPAILDELDKQGLEFASYYCTPVVENDLDPQLKNVIALLKGRRAPIEIAFTSMKYKPSDPAADAKALDILKRLADLAADTGPVISIYPHRGLWTEQISDGIRLAKQAGMKSVGTNLNLVHYEWVPHPQPFKDTLAEAMPYLKLVSINGMSKNNIVSLADGDYDIAAFLGTVKNAGYAGPIGLQCWGIKGPSETHLRRSMEKWLELRKTLEL